MDVWAVGLVVIAFVVVYGLEWIVYELIAWALEKWGDWQDGKSGAAGAD